MADIASCGSNKFNNCIPSGILCFRLIEKVHERYLVSEKRSKFDIQAAIQQLPLNVIEPSQRIYRQCYDRIRKRSNLICHEKSIVSERKVNYERGKLKRHSIYYTKEGPNIKNPNATPLLSSEASSTRESEGQLEKSMTSQTM